jgi:hypothetical protein
MGDAGYEAALWLITVVPVCFMVLAFVLLWWR